MERKRRRPQPGSSRAVVLLIVGCVAAFTVLLGGGAWVAWKIAKNQNRATQAELDAEREADRAETVAAFANPIPPTAEEDAQFKQFFEQLAGALDRGDEAAVTRQFDPERLVSELNRVGAFDKIPANQRRPFRTGVLQGAKTTLGKNLVANELMRWKHTDIRRVRWSADRKEVVVIADHRDAVGEELGRMKMRWWMIERSDGWKIYDFEDLDMGMRATQLMGALATPDLLTEFVKNPAILQTAVRELQTAQAALLVRKDPAEAEQAMARCRATKLPEPLVGLREFVEGVLCLQKSEMEKALVHFDKADRLLPGMPVVKVCRAAALNQLERYEEGLVQARGYIAELGPDPTALGHMGYALEGLSRKDEALDAYRKALDEDPDDETCLHGFRRMLPPEKKGELADRLMRCRKASEHFDSLLREARKESDDEGVKVLLAWLRKTKPDDPRSITETLRELVTAKKFAEAKTLLLKHLASAKPTDRTQILNAYLFAMLGAEKWREAYAAVPDEHAAAAFRLLAEEWEDDLSEADPDKPSPVAQQLTSLIADHRKRKPNDPGLWFYEGVLLQAKREFEKAEKLFAEGMKKLPERANPAEDDDDDFERDQFRSRRVTCLYELKQGLKAYAEVGPAAATFRQLAYRYDGDQDAAGLEALLTAHQKASPQDVALRYWRAEVLYLKLQYSAAAAGFRAYHKTAGDKAPEFYRVGERWVRSLIRANELAKARQAVIELGEDKVAVSLRAAIELLAGDIDAVERLMEEQSKSGGGLWTFYNDDDFTRLIAPAKFAETRKKYPDPRPKPTPKAAG